MEILIYMGAAVSLGICAIVLVSGELSVLSGISKSGRYVLAFFLSFGVLGFSVKTVAIGLLQHRPAMAKAVDVSRSTKSYENASDVSPRGLNYPTRSRAWEALPPIASNAPNAKVALGKQLFFDKRLSATGEVSCASCHILGQGGDDNKSVSQGVNGLKGGRNAPTVLNSAYMKRLFWDGRAKSLAEQAAGPLTNPVEMALNSPLAAVEIVNADTTYRALFGQLYGTPLQFNQIVDAISAFEETLMSRNAPYDQFVAGDEDALSPEQKKGMLLFDELGCRNCHMDPTFTVAGIEHKSPYRRFPVFKGSAALEKYNLTEDQGRNGKGVWRVPTLRNVARTAPYFHNGAVPDLKEAVQIMIESQLGLQVSETDNLTVSYDAEGAILKRDERSVTNAEVDFLVAFLESLSGEPLNVQDPWEVK